MVDSITVTSPGSGYSSAPAVTIEDPPVDLAFTTFWSNDDASVDGSEPVDAVTAPVVDGLFTVRLGNGSLPNMTTLSASLLQQPELELRIWFNDGVNGFAALSPTQPLTAAPYAMKAASVIDGAITGADVAANTFWQTGGNAGTTAGTHFLGTTDGEPLELRAAGGVGIGTANPGSSSRSAKGTRRTSAWEIVLHW